MFKNKSTKVKTQPKRAPKVLKWIIIVSIILSICNFSPLLEYCLEYNPLVPEVKDEKYERYNRTPDWTYEEPFLIATNACRIPNRNPFHKDILWRILYPLRSFRCDSAKPALVDSNDTSLFILHAIKLNYSLRYDEEGFYCCYSPFQRGGPQLKQTIFNQSCFTFTDSINVEDEFVLVKCKVYDEILYYDYFSFVPLKDNITMHMLSNIYVQAQRKMQSKKKLPPIKPLQPMKVPQPKRLNIFIVAIDTLSRTNLIRSMPKTYFYLKTIDAFDFKGYHKVGHNTFPNIMPMLTGKYIEETSECWNNTFVDKCDFIWKEYEKLGYLTSYAEDGDLISSFYYRQKGFNDQPTHYFWTFFEQLVWKNIGNNKKVNLMMCFGSRSRFQVFMDYTRKFVRSIRRSSKPHFALFWSNLMSHDNYNRPKLADNNFYKLFQEMHNDGDLNNTVLFLLSDHGPRHIDHYQENLEDRLPALLIRLPDWLRENYLELAENMERNTKRFTHHFDLYETLKHLLSPIYDIENSLKISLNDRFDKKKEEKKHKLRGLSLFEKIPDRTCAEAEGLEKWCTCLKSEPISKENVLVKNSTAFLVDSINKKLKNYSECSQLKLVEIIEVHFWKHGLLYALPLPYFTITFMLTPGHKIFTGTVIYNRINDFEVHGAIKAGSDIETANAIKDIDVRAINDDTIINNDRVINNKIIKGEHALNSCVLNLDIQIRPFCYCKKPNK